MDTKRYLVVMLTLAFSVSVAAAPPPDLSTRTTKNKKKGKAEPGAKTQEHEQEQEKPSAGEVCRHFAQLVRAKLANRPPPVVTDEVRDALTKLDIEGRAGCLRTGIATGFQSSPEEIVSTFLKTAGQIVVDRAISNAWSLLSTKLKEAADCSDTPPRFPATCKVLDDVRLQDLLASPRVLLDAALKDLMDRVASGIATLAVPVLDIAGTPVKMQEVLVSTVDAWRRGGRDAAIDFLRAEFASMIVEATVKFDVACTEADTCAALRSIGACLLEGAQKKTVMSCALAAGGYTVSPKVRDLTAAIQRAVLEDDRTALIKMFMSFVRERTANKAIVDALENVLLGIAEEDWSRVAAGGVAAIEAIDKKEGKLFKLLAAVGQYAATYTTKDQDAEAASAARRKAIEALMDATTDRSGREGDVVISVGGAFGVGWGSRRGIRDEMKDVKAFPTPLHLSLGFGIDAYHANTTNGFHGMLSLVDLSQYVSFEDKEFQVADPDAKAALAIGVTAGVRFALRQTPMFGGVNFTYSPFVPVPTEGETEPSRTGSYQLLFMLGVYVPFFDFN